MKNYTQEQKDAILREWENSGLSMLKWCRKNGFPVTTVYSWRRKKQKQPKLKREDFVALEAVPSQTELEIECRGIKITLSKDWDQKSLEKCLAALRVL